MEVKEINTILRYRRPCDSWLCPDCDTENPISLDKCTVCGSRKSPSTVILKQWTEADDRPVRPPMPPPGRGYVPGPAGPIFRDAGSGYIPKKEKNSIIIWVIIIAVIFVIGMIVAINQANTYDEYSDATREFSRGSYETAMATFENISSDYKDISCTADESEYQCVDNNFA